MVAVGGVAEVAWEAEAWEVVGLEEAGPAVVG